MKKILFLATLSLLTTQALADVSDSPSRREFFVPNGKCKISIPKSDFLISKEQIKATGTTAYYALGNEKKLMNFSFYIDTAPGPCDSNSKCLDTVLTNKAYEKAKGLKRYERAGFSVAEFTIEFPGKDNVTVIQKNVLAESYKDGCWVDIHLSQLGLDAPDVNNILPLLDDTSIQR